MIGAPWYHRARRVAPSTPRRAPLLAAAVCAAVLGWAEVDAADGAAGQGTVAFVGGMMAAWYREGR